MKKIFVFIIILINSCSYPEMIRNELVYQNDFENFSMESIDGGEITTYNNTKVLGTLIMMVLQFF